MHPLHQLSMAGSHCLSDVHNLYTFMSVTNIINQNLLKQDFSVDMRPFQTRGKY